MIIISSREFREKQASYLDRVDEGEEVLVQRGKNKSYKISAVKKDDSLMTKEEFIAKIDRALQEAKEGKGVVLRTEKELKDYFNELELRHKNPTNS
ncbi:MAG: prevent-host-death protein [Bacteroidales bacterium]